VSSTAVEARGVPAARDVFGLIGFVLLCFGVSILGGMAAAPALAGWYADLAKPTWTPPGWAFGPVWTLLYAMMAVAGWLVWREGRSRRATLLFLLQLALNAAWPWLFFSLRRPDWAFAAVVVLAVAILAAIVASLRVSRGAALLLVPYLGWVVFAAALTLAIWQMNPR
jgi:benzodiazapine receptor